MRCLTLVALQVAVVQAPGPIDNTGLIDEETSQLWAQLEENRDFKVTISPDTSSTHSDALGDS